MAKHGFLDYLRIEKRNIKVIKRIFVWLLNLNSLMFWNQAKTLVGYTEPLCIKKVVLRKNQCQFIKIGLHKNTHMYIICAHKYILIVFLYISRDVILADF